MDFSEECADAVAFGDVQFVGSEQATGSGDGSDVDALVGRSLRDGLGEREHPRGDLRGVQAPFGGDERL